MNNNTFTFDPMKIINETYETEMAKVQQKLQKWDEEHPLPKPDPVKEGKFSIEEVRELLHSGMTLAEIKEMEAKQIERALSK